MQRHTVVAYSFLHEDVLWILRSLPLSEIQPSLSLSLSLSLSKFVRTSVRRWAGAMTDWATEVRMMVRHITGRVSMTHDTWPQTVILWHCPVSTMKISTRGERKFGFAIISIISNHVIHRYDYQRHALSVYTTTTTTPSYRSRQMAMKLRPITSDIMGRRQHFPTYNILLFTS
jgi:hypothetical protein